MIGVLVRERVCCASHCHCGSCNPAFSTLQSLYILLVYVAVRAISLGAREYKLHVGEEAAELWSIKKKPLKA